MGRKRRVSTKLLRKQEEREEILASIVANWKVNTQRDPLHNMPAFRSYESKKGLQFELSCHPYEDLPYSVFEWIMCLENENMADLYRSCEWGWNLRKKREEMSESGARYLIATSAHDDKPVAFSHFRFDMHLGIEVIYCYELQLDPSVRRHGLGKFMLQILELICFYNNMQKVILTVLKKNEDALEFFRAQNYMLDVTSPKEDICNQQCYIIISKLNKKYIKAVL